MRSREGFPVHDQQRGGFASESIAIAVLTVGLLALPPNYPAISITALILSNPPISDLRLDLLKTRAIKRGESPSSDRSRSPPHLRKGQYRLGKARTKWNGRNRRVWARAVMGRAAPAIGSPCG